MPEPFILTDLTISIYAEVAGSPSGSPLILGGCLEGFNATPEVTAVGIVATGATAPTRRVTASQWRVTFDKTFILNTSGDVDTTDVLGTYAVKVVFTSADTPTETATVWFRGCTFEGDAIATQGARELRQSFGFAAASRTFD